MSSPLREACGQFEQVFLASLLPQSFVSPGSASVDESEEQSGAGQDLASQLFPEVFAAALERSGGVGLAGEFFRALTRPT